MKLIGRYCGPLTLSFLSNILAGQNLVPNGSFEDYPVCPGGYSQNPAEFRVDSWRTITMGSPDYFHSCSSGEASVPYNWAGVADAFDGDGYAGIYTWMNGGKDYREYLHCKLVNPLVKDSLYRVEFRYRLSSYSKYATDRLGVLLSDTLRICRSDGPLSMSPTVTFVKDSAITPETGGWELASAEYRARGNESFLTIGNFADNATTRHYFIKFRPASEPMIANSAYYYIDDVKVSPNISAPPVTPDMPVFTGVDPEFNTTYILTNIQFGSNSYALLPGAYFDLDRVANYLLDTPGVFVELAGHTDVTGDEGYNLKLSENRALSASGYLISKGVERKRISIAGYGEHKPLVGDYSENARDINRRVEIKFHR